MKQKSKLYIVAIIIVSLAILTFLHFYMRKELLNEDFRDASIVVAISDGPYLCRFVFKSDYRIEISTGLRAAYSHLLYGYSQSIEITSMAFMGRIEQKIEIAIEPEAYDEMVVLANEIIEHRDGVDTDTVFITGGLFMIIATHVTVREVIYIPGIPEFDYPRMTQLGNLLKEIVPIEIPHTIERSWR